MWKKEEKEYSEINEWEKDEKKALNIKSLALHIVYAVQMIEWTRNCILKVLYIWRHHRYVQ